ncbi:FAD-dependent oxidoreductase [Christensenellaceae bacterium OttesenSCG-928-M15]|nr:FAD-dependent oxidoreductase [Christensenellaceae bacterium OttesenSCG-928-M15]
MKRLVSIALALAFLLSLAACSTPVPEPEASPAAEPSAAPVQEQPKSEEISFQPGAYTSTQSGHNGSIVVEVTFDEKSITAIDVTEHAETSGIGDKAMDTLCAAIVGGQTLAVEAVSGATVSSGAFIAAVEDCVNQAGGSVELLRANAPEAQAPVAAENMSLTADFVVVGGGPAGLAAAVKAAENGLKVVLFEKASVTGGAANMGMGPLAIQSSVQKAQGDDMTVDEAYDMFMEYTHYRSDGVLVRNYFDMSASTIDWLSDMGVEFEEAARYFEKSYASWHIVKKDDDPAGGNNAATMARRMTERAKELGVEIYLDTAGTQIKLESGAVSGAKALSMDETKAYDVTAKAVLIATGGFGDNAQMVYEELGYTYNEDFFGMRLIHHDGDGIRMADAAGAGRSQVNIEMIFNVYRPGSQSSCGYDVTYAMRQPNLLVNVEGNRFFNEEQVQNTTYCGNALVQQTGNAGFMIMDETIKEDYRKNGVPFKSRVYNIPTFETFDETLEKALSEGYTAVQKADTIAELAALMGIDAAALEKTVEEYNAICATKNDPMGKSAEYLRPIENGPFYAASFYPSSYGTLGGIKINSNLEVVTSGDQVINGLYAAGTDACTIFGDSYMFLLPGNTMGFSVNSGVIAGENAANYISNK